MTPGSLPSLLDISLQLLSIYSDELLHKFKAIIDYFSLIQGCTDQFSCFLVLLVLLANHPEEVRCVFTSVGSLDFWTAIDCVVDLSSESLIGFWSAWEFATRAYTYGETATGSALDYLKYAVGDTKYPEKWLESAVSLGGNVASSVKAKSSAVWAQVGAYVDKGDVTKGVSRYSQKAWAALKSLI